MAVGACGTTAPASQGAGSGSGVTGSGGGGLAAAEGGGSSSGSTSGFSAPGAGQAGGSPGGSSVSGGSTDTSGSTGRGGASAGAISPTSNTSQPVRLGVVYIKISQSLYSSVGGKSATTDAQADYQAVVRDINAHHGIAGHTVVGSYYAIDPGSSTPGSVQLQAACTHFTQDQHVDVVLSYTPGANNVLADCLEAAHIPLIVGADEADVGGSTLTANPLLWEPAQVSLDRLERTLPGFLVSQHWIDARWPSPPQCSAFPPRIGVVTFDMPDWHAAYDHALAPAFKAAGHPVTDVEFLNLSGSTANQLAAASTGAENAVVRFANDCVDHVVFVSNVAVDYLFMDVAGQQHFNPRYGLSSLEDPPVVVQNVSGPGPQLHGAMSLGWSPVSDVLMSDFDATAKAPGQHCLDVLSHANLSPADNNAAFLALPSCEGPYFAAEVFGRWLQSPGSRLLDAVNGLGSSYRPAGTYTATLSDTQHDGASGYRASSFVDSCTCFRYTSGVQSW